MAIVLASLFVLAVTSCTWPNNAEVLITGGYITGSGNEAVLECELYNLDVPTDFIDESCTPTLAVALSSVDGYAVISGEGSRIILDGSVSTADGPTLTCTIDITAQLEDRFWGPGGEYGSIRYIYHFSKEQTPTIPIYNQFYLDPPLFVATRHTVRLELTRGETTRLLSITSQSPNRIDFDADRRDFDDAPILIQIEDIGGSISYLQSDGTLSGAPTAFNPSIVFGPGAVLDASSILIDE